MNSIRQYYSSFKEHFKKSQDKQQVVSFLSSNRNLLIVPFQKDDYDYKNISNFTKNSSEQQQFTLWKEIVCKSIQAIEIDKKKLFWLSTHDLGVHYSHVRIEENRIIILMKSINSYLFI